MFATLNKGGMIHHLKTLKSPENETGTSYRNPGISLCSPLLFGNLDQRKNYIGTLIRSLLAIPGSIQITKKNKCIKLK